MGRWLDLISGSRRQIMRHRPLFISLGFAGALLGLIITLVGWMHWQESVTALRTQVTTNATVTALSTQIGWASYRNPTANSGGDVVEVRFTDKNGATRNVGISQYVGSNEISRLRVGEAVPILYNPANFADVHLKVSLVRLAKPTVMAMGTALFLASLALEIVGLRRPRVASISPAEASSAAISPAEAPANATRRE